MVGSASAESVEMPSREPRMDGPQKTAEIEMIGRCLCHGKPNSSKIGKPESHWGPVRKRPDDLIHRGGDEYQCPHCFGPWKVEIDPVIDCEFVNSFGGKWEVDVWIFPIDSRRTIDWARSGSVLFISGRWDRVKVKEGATRNDLMGLFKLVGVHPIRQKVKQ
jgi:hypothetical protein